MGWRINNKMFASAVIAPQVSKNDISENKTETSISLDALKAEILLWIFSVISAVLVYVTIALVTVAVYHPDINALKATANKLLLMPYLAIPEPVETMLFRLAVLTIIPMLLVFYYLFSRMKWINALAQKKIFFLLFSIMCIAFMCALVYFDFASDNTPGGTGKRLPELAAGVRDSTFNFFFDGFFIGDYLWLYALVVVPVVDCFFFIGIKKYHWENIKVLNWAGLLLAYGIIGVVLFAIMDMNTFYFPYANSNKYDFNAVYYSMTQVYAGVPMLVDGFTNTYGLYPHFLNPFFQVIGLSVLKFSATMSVLLGLAFVLNFYSVKKFIGNGVILFLGFTTMLFFSYLDRKLTTDFDCYFALFPVRYIIPSVLLFLAALYLVKPSQKMYWAIFIIMAFFVLWNPEIGIVCYLSWIIVNLYVDFFTAEGKINIKKLLLHVATGIGVLLGAMYAYKAVIFLCYGSSPDLSLLWSTMSVFSNVGFMALPMTLVNPWNLVGLILIIGFLYAIVKFCHKAVTPKSAFILLLSLIGLGYLFYFQCRSHNGTLVSCVGFSILLLTLLGDELWQMARDRNVLFLNSLFVIVLFLLSFSFIELGFNADKIYKMVQQEDDKATTKAEQGFVGKNKDFIVSNSKEHEKINVMTLMKFHGLCFDGTKRVSAFNPGLMDMLLNADLERFQNIIRDSSFNIFMDAEHYVYPYMQRTLAEVYALYEFKATNSMMVLLRKRKTAIPADTFFKDHDQLVIQRKYKDDTAGLNARINDAFGISHILLRPEFSVQVLFFSRPQLYPFAAIVGNTNEPRGFAICNTFNSPNYLFAVNGKAFIVPLQYNKWVYAVMNVYPDHMDVFINGELAKTFALSGPILQAGDKLSIGNLGNMHYYVGAISEVAIHDKVFTPGAIKQTWQEIDSVVSKRN